jgi:hypothetical protein
MTTKLGTAALLAMLSACATPAAVSNGSEPAPSAAAVHHDLRISLEPAARRLAVEDTVTLSPELRAHVGDVVPFSLHAGLAPERVGGAKLEPLGRDEGGPVPIERFAVRLAPGDRTFTLRHGGELFHPVREAGDDVRKDSDSPGLVSADGVVLQGESGWFPALADESLTFTLEVRLPPGWDAVSQGARTRHERSERGTLVRWESPEPQQEVFLVAAPFVERSRTDGRVTVQTFLRKDDPALADTYLDAGERYLAMYDALLGPFPYAKFAVVENFWETGYGMPSFTLLGPHVIRLPFLVDSSYPHEILHNWWGNGVFVDPVRGNWSEGLTAYLADHLVQEQRGKGAEHRRASLQRFADYVATNADFPVREFRARHGEVTQAVGYDKVLMLFHMLRQRIGDERFVAGLRRFYAENRFRDATFSAVGRSMSVAAGEDLGAWFAQWLDRPGAPALRLESATAASKDGHSVLALTLGQSQPGATFELDVPVAVTLASSPEAVRRVVRLTERRQTFSIELEGKPVRVDVDPEFDVFRRLDPAELPPALSGAFGARAAVLVLPVSAPPDLRSAYAALATQWKRAGSEVVTDAQLARIPAGKAVWILGWENRLRGAVASALGAHGATLGPDALRLGATALSRKDRTVVAAARSPADPAQVVVFVGAERPGALPGLARKLPHYGGYGLLAFEGDAPTNVAKESWPVLQTPLAAAVGTASLVERAALPPRVALAEVPRSAVPARGTAGTGP